MDINILLTTGGTGGHIFPALAVAEEIRRRHPQARLLFVGSLYGPEARLARVANIPFEGLPVRGFLGRGLKAVEAGLRMTWAVGKAAGSRSTCSGLPDPSSVRCSSRASAEPAGAAMYSERNANSGTPRSRKPQAVSSARGARQSRVRLFMGARPPR